MATRAANQSTAVSALAVSATALCCVTLAAWIAYHEGRRRGQQSERAHKCDDTNDVKTPTATTLNCDDQNSSKNPKNEIDSSTKTSSSPAPFTSLPIYPIGTLNSIYRLCVGTPRQGMLAPHARGIVTFDETKVSKDAILELQHYSHVFVVFVFHLNSNKNNSKKNGKPKAKGGQQQQQFPSKIAPPSLGGKKVGVFSTRTPHRPNPIGFSLCRLDKVIVHNKKKKTKAGEGTFSLLLSGLDIVDGTPILDIKPYVPHYDCVGYSPSSLAGTPSTTAMDAASLTAQVNGISTTSTEMNPSDIVRVPHWVDSGLQKRRNVTFLPAANQFLQDLSEKSTSTSLTQPSLTQLQFYGPHSPWKDSPDQSVTNLKQCILELLGVDVRSAWQTKKARKGKFQAERSSRLKEWNKGNGSNSNTDTTTTIDGSVEENGNGGPATISGLCTQQIDNLLVQYTIEEPGSALYSENAGDKLRVDERSMGSGAEDIVVVHFISIIE